MRPARPVTSVFGDERPFRVLGFFRGARPGAAGAVALMADVLGQSRAKACPSSRDARSFDLFAILERTCKRPGSLDAAMSFLHGDRARPYGRSSITAQPA